ncbi:MAG: phospholipase D family protein, partial [Chloroflexota bacterium]|nr:phospholipase D family protein [Chloroflexota bacterium]
DTPVHNDSRITFFVDGRMTMLSMCQHFLKARRYIYLANWGMTPEIELVRGRDHRAGPDGSHEQEKLLAELRTYGLQEADIAFWCTQALSVKNVLGYALNKGVEVKVLLWGSPNFLTHTKAKEAHDLLTQIGISCLLDESALALKHPTESLHQKISIVDGTHAFVGGVDPMIEREDFDRWDTQEHLFSSPLRRTSEGTSPHPWHDAHTLIEGPAAGDVELNFQQRWNDVIHKKRLDANQLVPEHPTAPPVEGNSIVQVARTIPRETYSFAPDQGIQGIAQLYAKAFGNAQHFIYLENQYFWLHAFGGLDIAFLGFDNPEMETNIKRIGKALRQGAALAIVLPDHPNAGRAFTDAALARLKQEAPDAFTKGRIQAFCLATSETQEDGEHYRPIYVHAKVAIIDDTWATVGSGNLNNRGMLNDVEMNVAALDPTLARGLRMMLWAEHLGLYSEAELFDLAYFLGQQHQSSGDTVRGENIWQSVQEMLGDPHAGLHMMVKRAQDNLLRYKARQPLLGQLLPYLTAEEATQQGLNFREEHGWIEEE